MGSFRISAFAERLAGWVIPYPAFNAAFSAYTECIGGVFTMVGSFTRLVSIPMMINMLVAVGVACWATWSR